MRAKVVYCLALFLVCFSVFSVAAVKARKPVNKYGYDYRSKYRPAGGSGACFMNGPTWTPSFSMYGPTLMASSTCNTSGDTDCGLKVVGHAWVWNEATSHWNVVQPDPMFIETHTIACGSPYTEFFDAFATAWPSGKSCAFSVEFYRLNPSTGVYSYVNAGFQYFGT